MTELTEAQMLRQQARELRYSAAHAERAGDARADMSLARELDLRADALEGVVRRAPVAAQCVSQEEQEARRKAKIKAAFMQLEDFFGPSARNIH